MPKKLTQEEAIARMRAAQPDRRDDFSKFIYLGYHEKGIVICPEHGEYEIDPANYVAGHSCRQCVVDKAKQSYSKTTEEFIEEARQLFPQYDYSKVNYENAYTKVEIICPKHGSFFKAPSMFLFKKQGCPECSRVKKASNTEEFIIKARKIFPQYDYSRVNYYNKRTKVEVVCPKHGSFFIKPNDLLSDHGCSKCSRSKNNELIDKLLTEWSIEHEMEFVDERCRYKKELPFDCYVPKFNLLIEYQGKQHYHDMFGHEALHERKFKDKIKKQFALNNGYNFEEINYTENTEERLTEIVKKYKIESGSET